ncbi:hypothetical protein [Streptomyces lomondensis]|uniref:Uncharacterized protein n=1 Tax=Streptomyces lomondensis TaxID=68229 RepID=A0ABQ2XJK5_9ACTN|nr:hypothetical protein [Streptomyces lomondensis]MCF0083269.1 hypothetical protein [Streptomyces lomondensis]GGX20385.1 hypothetical protein GCM10010383_58390 [Streptomyces lomondensis]
MPDYVHGTSAYSADELVSLVSHRLGLVFTERDSFFLGVHHVADMPGGRITVQPNAIPGDDGEDDLYAEEHPADWVLLLTTTSVGDPALPARLDSIEGLVRTDNPR